MPRLDPHYWSPFWKNPTITSFGNLFPKNYDDSMLEFWRGQLDPPPAHVVDVACGNGAVTWLIDEILNSGQGSTIISGVDFANIAPFEALGLSPKDYPNVEFIANTAVEKLPFSDASIDIVVSQYGIEYSVLDRSIPEIARVLTPVGRMAFILHDEQSVILQGATENIEDFKKIVEEIALHEPLLELCVIMDASRNRERLAANPEFQNLVAKINTLRYEVDFIVRKHMRKSQDTSVLTRYLQRLDQAIGEVPKKRKVSRQGTVERARDALREHIQRVEDLQSAALSAEDRGHLVDLVEGEGFRVTINETLEYRSSGNMGTAFAASRQ